MSMSPNLNIRKQYTQPSVKTETKTALQNFFEEKGQNIFEHRPS